MLRAIQCSLLCRFLLRNRKWNLVHLLPIDTRHSENKKVLLPSK
nr:MAG TPA: hypothetical protein [Caudoviricetes sp.]